MQRKREVDQMKKTMVRQLKKSVEVEKMPSVRVRPTLKVEMKHRVMKVKMPRTVHDMAKEMTSSGAFSPSKPISKDELIDMTDLEDRVLKAVKNSKRANIGGDNAQMEMIENCRKEIASSLNLDQIRRSLESKSVQKKRPVQ